MSDAPAHAYIFVSGQSVDAYVNVVGAIYHEYADSKVEIVFVAIDGDDDATTVDSDSAVGRVHARVVERIRELSSGDFGVRTNLGDATPRTPSGPSIYLESLRRLEQASSYRVVRRSDLDATIAEYARDPSALFDVTATLKSHLLDICTLLLSRGCRNIRYFELVNPPRHDERDLLHHLGPLGYRYMDLSQSSNVVAASRRMARHSEGLRLVILMLIAFTVTGILVQFARPGTALANLLQVIAIGTGSASAALQVIDFRRK